MKKCILYFSLICLAVNLFAQTQPHQSLTNYQPQNTTRPVPQSLPTQQGKDLTAEQMHAAIKGGGDGGDGGATRPGWVDEGSEGM